MKKYLLNIGGFCLIAFLASCGGDDPLPAPVIDFEVTTELEVLEIGNPIEFTNNTLNASSYSWDFGDGGTSTDVNPEYTYEEAGNYTVVLTAFTDDDQSDSLSLDISVGQRILTDIAVFAINFSQTNQDGTTEPWDAGSGPDVIIVFGPEGDDGSNSIASATLADVEETGFQGFSLTLNDDVPLTNENWVFSMFDDDSDEADGAFETMIQSNPFNPITNSNSFINTDTNEGSVQISGGGFDIFIVFEVR